MTIEVVIGQAGAGKTNYVMKNYFNDKMKLVSTPIKHTTDGVTCLIGDYTIEDRCKGTDTLAYNSLPKIKRFIAQNRDFEKTVVEGDRINNLSFFTYLLNLRLKLSIVAIYCPISVSFERLKQAKSQISLKFIKATRTKTLNNVKWLISRGQKCQIIKT
ncbi:MAG: hypothetical protein IAE98_05040 [Candidatus Kapabacteria bacterium]|nr:hypothetical protein [Candidatus Kapabacteria bacterium]